MKVQFNSVATLCYASIVRYKYWAKVGFNHRILSVQAIKSLNIFSWKWRIILLPISSYTRANTVCINVDLSIK